jgi:hypothetical protein
VTVQAALELKEYVTFTIQLPDGFGPYEIPPPSVKVTGKEMLSSASAICPPTVMEGSPLNVVPVTVQLVGVTVILVTKSPVPEVFRVPLMSPLIAIVPPDEHAPL